MANMISFEQFKATRVWCDDLGAYFKGEWEEVTQGYLYVEGGLYIEACSNQYRLQIECDEWTSKDLESLERKLYEYGLAEGHCEQE